MRVPGMTGYAVALALLASSGVAVAQPSTAQSQFDYGLAEMMAGRYATGCPALAASQKSEPRLGTLFTLGECEFRWGHSSSALRHLVAYLDAVVRTPSSSERALQGDRVKIATAHRAELERVVAMVTIVLPEGTPADAVVRVDGEVVERGALAAPFAMDPGAHAVQLALGGATSNVPLHVEKGERRRVELSMPVGPDTASAVVAGPETHPTSDIEAPKPARLPSSNAGTWMWITGGIGAAGLATGSIAGIVALTEKAAASASCGTNGLSPGQCTSQQGVEAGKAARTWADVATVGFGVGAAGVASLVVVWALQPPASAPGAAWQPAIGAGRGLAWVSAARAW